jgi:hypothetical protein
MRRSYKAIDTFPLVAEICSEDQTCHTDTWHVEHGHMLIPLPPDTCNLSPLELVRLQIESFVRSNNTVPDK